MCKLSLLCHLLAGQFLLGSMQCQACHPENKPRYLRRAAGLLYAIVFPSFLFLFYWSLGVFCFFLKHQDSGLFSFIMWDSLRSFLQVDMKSHYCIVNTGSSWGSTAEELAINYVLLWAYFRPCQPPVSAWIFLLCLESYSVPIIVLGEM